MNKNANQILRVVSVMTDDVTGLELIEVYQQVAGELMNQASEMIKIYQGVFGGNPFDQEEPQPEETDQSDKPLFSHRISADVLKEVQEINSDTADKKTLFVSCLKCLTFSYLQQSLVATYMKEKGYEDLAQCPIDVVREIFHASLSILESTHTGFESSELVWNDYLREFSEKMEAKCTDIFRGVTA